MNSLAFCSAFWPLRSPKPKTAYLHLYEHHAALMRFIASLGTPMPREFSAAIEYAINSLMRRACSGEELDGERIRTC